MALMLTVVGLGALAVLVFIAMMVRSIRGDKTLDDVAAGFNAMATEDRRRQALIETATPEIERGAMTLGKIEVGQRAARESDSLDETLVLYTATSDLDNRNGIWML